jgi:ferritin-like metal-binding protein YciE
MYVAWLNNAYAMEVDIIKTLESHVRDAEDYPEVQKKIKKHLEETRSHADKVKECIEANGGSVSTIQEGVANMMGMAKGASTAMAHDKIVKNALAEYATEHLEIAAYTALMEAARAVEDDESILVFEEIMKDEVEMAKILEKDFPKLVQKFLETHE